MFFITLNEKESGNLECKKSSQDLTLKCWFEINEKKYYEQVGFELTLV